LGNFAQWFPDINSAGGGGICAANFAIPKHALTGVGMDPNIR
jgi:hypothetical protein